VKQKPSERLRATRALRRKNLIYLVAILHIQAWHGLGMLENSLCPSLSASGRNPETFSATKDLFN